MGLSSGEEKIQGNVVEHFTRYELKKKKKKWIYRKSGYTVVKG